MKKLRMIVTFVVVLAIVVSAFAFNAKGVGRFCVSANNSSTDCSATFVNSRRITIQTGSSTERKFYCLWDGTSTTSCTDLTTECQTLGTFDAD